MGQKKKRTMEAMMAKEVVKMVPSEKPSLVDTANNNEEETLHVKKRKIVQEEEDAHISESIISDDIIQDSDPENKRENPLTTIGVSPSSEAITSVKSNEKVTEKEDVKMTEKKDNDRDTDEEESIKKEEKKKRRELRKKEKQEKKKEKEKSEERRKERRKERKKREELEKMEKENSENQEKEPTSLALIDVTKKSDAIKLLEEQLEKEKQRILELQLKNMKLSGEVLIKDGERLELEAQTKGRENEQYRNLIRMTNLYGLPSVKKEKSTPEIILIEDDPIPIETGVLAPTDANIDITNSGERDSASLFTVANTLSELCDAMLNMPDIPKIDTERNQPDTEQNQPEFENIIPLAPNSEIQDSMTIVGEISEYSSLVNDFVSGIPDGQDHVPIDTTTGKPKSTTRKYNRRGNREFYGKVGNREFIELLGLNEKKKRKSQKKK